MSKQSIQIDTIFRPIQTIKSIKLSQKQNQSYYFILSTVDLQVMLIQIICQQDPHNSMKNRVSQKHNIVQVDSVVTAMHFDKKNRSVYLGCYNGDVIKASIIKLPESQHGIEANVLELQSIKHVANKSIQAKAILTVYETGKQLVSISIEGRVNVYEVSQLAILHSFKLSAVVTACTSFFNPYSGTNVSCVALTFTQPKSSLSHPHPFIFNCKSEAEFVMAIQSTINLQQCEPHPQQEQIIAICDDVQVVDAHDEVIVACGTTSSSGNMIVLYNIVHHEDLKIYYLEPILKFKVQNFILHMSMKCQVLAVSMFDSILFVDLVNKTKLQCIEKQDLDVTIVFVLNKNENSIKFMANKGFNFMQPDKYHDGRLKLRVRDRPINKKK